MKQSSFTGQETYLPRDLVLERIRFILEKKDMYSLEEIRAMLVTPLDGKELTWDGLAALEEMDMEIALLIKKEEYSYLEAGWMFALSEYRRKYQLTLEQIEGVCRATQGLLEQMGNEGKQFLIFQIEGMCYGAIAYESGRVVMEERIGQIERYSVNKLASRIKEKFL